MTEVLKIEPEAIEAMATRFAERATTINEMLNSFKATITVIQLVAFKGHVGDDTLEKFDHLVRPRLVAFQIEMDEISKDLKQTVADYIAEDQEASAFFQDGGGGGGLLAHTTPDGPRTHRQSL